MSKKVIIIGAGPGGLSCGMILASAGYDVQIYEKRSKIGGRNASIKLGEYTFDIGPTFFLMKDALEEVFEQCNKKLEDYVTLQQIEPMYKLQYKDRTLYPSTDYSKMIEDLEKNFPGSTAGYNKYLEREKEKYNRLVPCLKVPYGKITDYATKRLMRSVPYLDAHLSIYDVMSKYYEEKDLRLSFTFQAKYIGMSPWEAPGTFSIISYIEHGGGVYHVKGGLNQLAVAMGKSIIEDGGTIHLDTEVKEIITEDDKAVGIKLATGEIINADYVVINADFAHAMTTLIPEKKREKYTDAKINKMKYSCSTFMLYLGVNKVYDNMQHHNIIFADDYERNVNEISNKKIISKDPSIYVQNASITDESLAPAGKSTIYILVPAPNNTSDIDWDKEKENFRNIVLDRLENKAGMTGLREHIEEELVITPKDWQEKMDVYNGATFNLSHNLMQMLYFRPHNEFEEFKNCFLVGGGTHPGSGLPTIYESGKISAELIINHK